MPAAESQNQLLRRAQEGDEQALEALLRSVQPQLYRFSMKMCRQTQDAEDVLQDSMLAMARSFRDFRGNSSFSTWLFTIARSFCIKKRRKAKFAPKHEESLEGLKAFESAGIASSDLNPEQQAASNEVWQKVQQGIKQIEPDYREVLILRDIEGLRAKEVAEIVGISVSAVKSRLHRARSELREVLAPKAYLPRQGCPNIRQIFSEHLEGDLAADICTTLQVHVDGCPVCAAECDGLKMVMNVCNAAPCELPIETQERLEKSLRAILEGAQPS
ncbi:MAG: sigma-70 family RNA polymerase sigma factor [Myxococcota bacterium]|nr:sigma-70 family RNA polymerase sigma factor [Myxococcota bacterium]